MPRPVLAALAALALAPAALAQMLGVSPGAAPGASSGTTTTFSPSTQQVQFLAPQLIAFAGSTDNFESLVTGLTSGTAVTLATASADGSVQTVTFTPGNAVPAGDAARLLETARQNLISRGVAAPTGAQIAASLMGGTITTASGASTLTGVLTATSSSPTPVLVRTSAAAPQNTAASSSISASQLAAVRNALSTGSGVTLTSGSGATTQNVVFSPTGVRLTDFEANQALQLAGTLLAQQGVLNPTADQLRAALFGGTIAANGASIALQGILQGRVPSTSTSGSTTGITSTSPSTNTGNSTVAGASSGSSGSTAAPLGAIVPRGNAGPARLGAR